MMNGLAFENDRAKKARKNDPSVVLESAAAIIDMLISYISHILNLLSR